MKLKTNINLLLQNKYMKKLLILILSIQGIVGTLPAQNRSINFVEGKTFAELKELAKKENKLLFLDFYAWWCGPCKKMDKEVYTNDSVADFFNKNFINAKMNTKNAETKELGKKYKLFELPALLFLSPDGVVENIDAGFKSVKDFIQLGSDAIDPKKQFSKLEFKMNDSINSLVKKDSLICVLSYGVESYCMKQDSVEYVVSYFGNDSKINNKLLPESEKLLSDLYFKMTNDPTLNIRIVGYVNDFQHSYIKGYLIRAADRWIEATSEYLTSKEISPKRISTAVDIRCENVKILKGKSGMIDSSQNQKLTGVEITRVK